MRIKYHKNFEKNFKKRIRPNPALAKRFLERLSLLLTTPNAPSLHDHQLIGKFKTYRSFSLTGDYRVIYRKEGGDILLFDVGTHNQVY